jgi:hypothetical protein
MNKRGQFYLIAALVVVSILIGFITITNSSSNQGNQKIYNLQEEIGLESMNVLDYGNNNSLTTNEMQTLLTDFSENYINNSQDSNFYFVFGTNQTVRLVAYQKTEVPLNFSGTSQNIVPGAIYITDVSPNGNSITLNVNNNPYTFDLYSEEKFYYVLYNLNNGEVYTVQN